MKSGREKLSPKKNLKHDLFFKSRYSTETENFSADNFLTEYSVGRESRVSVLRTLVALPALFLLQLVFKC